MQLLLPFFSFEPLTQSLSSMSSPSSLSFPSFPTPPDDLANLQLSDAQFGILCYATGLATLTVWEEVVVPKLKLKGWIPDKPLNPRALSERDKAAKWVVPLTADRTVPLPNFDELVERGPFPVGRTATATQLIYVGEDRAKQTPGVDEVSAEWSKFYKGETIRIRKVRRVLK